MQGSCAASAPDASPDPRCPGAPRRASLSGSVRLPGAGTRVGLFGPGEELVHDTAGIDHGECRPVPRREFATAVRTGVGTGIDAAHGLRPQRLLDMAARTAG